MTERKTVAIVGVGALGSHVAQFLRNEASLRVVDFDRVEQKNVLSQFHGRPGVGKAKVAALAQAMQFLWGEKIAQLPHRLAETNVAECLGGVDLVVDCLDNGASRRIVQAHVRARGIPCVHGALAADGGFGRVVWDERFEIDDEAGAGTPTCEGGEHLPFVVLVAALISRAAQSFLRDGTRRGFEVTPGPVVPT